MSKPESVTALKVGQNYCSQCAAPIPSGQRICSMCMGDIDHGSDGYYRQIIEDEHNKYGDHGDE